MVLATWGRCTCGTDDLTEFREAEMDWLVMGRMEKEVTRAAEWVARASNGNLQCPSLSRVQTVTGDLGSDVKIAQCARGKGGRGVMMRYSQSREISSSLAGRSKQLAPSG